MGAAALVIILAGMVVPITLLLATLAFDLGVLVWVLHRWWKDRGRTWLLGPHGRRRVGAGVGRTVELR